MTIAIVVTSLALAISIHFFARRRPAYGHVVQTISELGERGCRDNRIVSLGIFLPAGLALAATSFTLRASSPPTAALAAAIAVGYCGAALFPCDPGSPLQGSARQAIHILAGGVQSIGGALALWRLGAQGGFPFYALAAIVASAVVFLSIPSLGAWRGAAQRAGEAALFVGPALALGMQNAAS